jgi:hypothetical protein
MQKERAGPTVKGRGAENIGNRGNAYTPRKVWTHSQGQIRGREILVTEETQRSMKGKVWTHSQEQGVGGREILVTEQRRCSKKERAGPTVKGREAEKYW